MMMMMMMMIMMIFDSDNNNSFIYPRQVLKRLGSSDLLITFLCPIHTNVPCLIKVAEHSFGSL